MAATFGSYQLGHGAGLPGQVVPARVTVTFTGVTTAEIPTKLSRVLFGGQIKCVTGTGGGACVPSTTVPGQLDASGFTAGDVIEIGAAGYLR